MEALIYFYLWHDMVAKSQHNGQVYLVTVSKKEAHLPLLPNTEYNTAIFLSLSSLPKISNIKGPNPDLLFCLHHLKKKQTQALSYPQKQRQTGNQRVQHLLGGGDEPAARLGCSVIIST